MIIWCYKIFGFLIKYKRAGLLAYTTTAAKRDSYRILCPSLIWLKLWWKILTRFVICCTLFIGWGPPPFAWANFC